MLSEKLAKMSAQEVNITFLSDVFFIYIF